MTTEKTKKIAELNDSLRLWLSPALGRVLITHGIRSLTDGDQLEIVSKVRRFDAFSDGNDPYAERDFGAFEHGGDKVFWKIDYYNRAMDGGSPDPSDPALTTRVLTIMLAQEY